MTLTKTIIRVLRTLPFLVLAALSIRAAAQAPQGRGHFAINMGITADGLAEAVTKIPHIRTCAVLFLLATIAVGSRRLSLAFGLTMLIGASWEVAEATGIGRNSRLVDLAPDLIGTFLSLVLVLLIRSLVNRFTTWQRGAQGQPETG
jgi:VanZ family protein